jgi:hypothetical protein
MVKPAIHDCGQFEIHAGTLSNGDAVLYQELRGGATHGSTSN